MAKKVEKTDDKQTSKVKAALELLHKKFGPESAMTFSDIGIEEVNCIDPGSLRLAKALGGGWPRGRVSILWGGYSAGKSTCCLHACANAQREGLTVAYIDMEHALDIGYAKSLGCDMDNLILSQPDNGTQACSIIKELAMAGACDLIILDSIAACLTEAEINGELSDANIGSQAKLMSAFFRQTVPALEKSNCALICTNQVRQKPGVMFGSPDVMPAGKAAEFAASIICRLTRIASKVEKDKNGEAVANQIRIKVEKNKVAPPFKEVELNIYYGKGFDQSSEIFDIAVDFGLIEKAGAWFSYNGEKIGQGAVKAKEWLNDNAEIREDITKRVKEIIMKSNSELTDLTQPKQEESNYDPNTGEIIE